MFELRKLFSREARSDPDSDYHASADGEGMEAGYQALISALFTKWGIAEGCVAIEVRRIGKAPDGRDVMAGMVRLNKYERDTAARLLLGLPLLENRLRKHARATWMSDFSHFGGLWLHASEQLGNDGVTELRDMLLQLVPPSAPAPGQPAAQGPNGWNASSLPGALASTPSEPAGPVSATPLAG